MMFFLKEEHQGMEKNGLDEQMVVLFGKKAG
jgi:hypothetical protein